MESKFAFNKLMFLEMDRKNILLDRRQTAVDNSHFLATFLASSRAQSKTKGSVSKCLFGRPAEGETRRLEQKMFHQERIRALNLYQFDVLSEQPVNLTPPASPHIGSLPTSSCPLRLPVLPRQPKPLVSTETPVEQRTESRGQKRKSTDAEEEEEVEQGNPSTEDTHDLKRTRLALE